MTNIIPGSPDTVPAQMDYSKTLNIPKPDVENPNGLDTQSRQYSAMCEPASA